MSQLDLEICLSNLEYLIEFKSSLIESQQASEEDFFELCEHFRDLGCGRFLLTLDKAEFNQQLSKSVNCYLQLLDNFERFGFDPYYRCRSRSVSIFDAITISDSQSLTRIDDLLSSEPVNQIEYEEEFYFIFILTKIALKKFNQNELEEKVAEFSSLSGAEESQVMLFNSFLNNDAILFEDAITEMVAQWQEDIVKKRQNETIDPYFNLTAANIFIKGLAIIKLASARGLNISGKVRYIPSALL